MILGERRGDHGLRFEEQRRIERIKKIGLKSRHSVERIGGNAAEDGGRWYMDGGAVG